MMRTLADKLQLHIRPVDGRFDVGDLVAAFASQPGGFVLESACNTAGYGQHTILGRRPVRTLDIEIGREGDAFAVLESAIAGQPRIEHAETPFAAGWVGAIPYEAGAAANGVHRDPVAGEQSPRLRFALYDSAVVVDRAAGTCRISAVDLPDSTRPAARRLDDLEALLQGSAGAGGRYVKSAGAVPRPEPNMSRLDYLRKARTAQEHIAAGDIYQVNLTQRFTTTADADPLALYLRLREANPADYAAFLSWPDCAVLCASPELFLDFRPDGRVITRPIKGTRPRGSDAREDAAQREALAASEKDRAELNMIIDLLRNDLGRVCSFGSVRVLEEHALEPHPTVWHLVSTIEGRLRQGTSPVELLRAGFPGGSITGCPKIRAMQIIRELEPTPRDVYCGSVGYIGLDGAMAMNIAIRTMLWRHGRLHIYAGGAITSDSDPAAEYEEALVKAEGMFQALGHSSRDLKASDS